MSDRSQFARVTLETWNEAVWDLWAESLISERLVGFPSFSHAERGTVENGTSMGCNLAAKRSIS